MATSGINVSFGGLNLSTPPIIVPRNTAIGNMSQQVIQNMQNSEGAVALNAAPAYSVASALMANNTAYQTGQNANNANFINNASQDMQYQANKISNQGKGK